MSTDSPSSGPLIDPLARRLGHDASCAEIAAALGEVWLEIDQALSPVVGQRGSAALFARSFQLAATELAWADLQRAAPQAPLDAAAWAALFAACSRDDALRFAGSFLQQFHALLASLIGPSFTERLLRPAWTPSAPNPPNRGVPAQDP